ncbi:hypothetical protein LQF61_00630 [Tetragenococcus koreensis]|uniref:DNA-directed RNA polymerase beta subunit n=1 Tax=Tetragenococcus koreensis TaxID=290335 RepID=A0AAN4RLM7_9ENTE|nr:hypothetical protein [Tetragenococcus koreensis]AYW45118.1 hypothetical protein C7K43_03720 [Tetragenococcus koreensis]MCF1584454.1 hypothetical protein [Tetragenococcus koreensis]MCF1614003.1 hypothetical protein [Tetragenococcus koreensis]MCF1618341.1 hypothetical protein [Tetragenococcus koreensis]MCF1618597.1 hypothetical protein [Tetragenococcus koreensis]
MSTLHDYVDRKRLKWMGFYLSEHTAQMVHTSLEEYAVVEEKNDMISQEITEVMEEALLKDKSVAIQTNELVNHSYLPDVIGKIKGHNEDGVFIDETFVAYDAIKHIEFYQYHKWSEID